jgi:hypothetical protein
LEGGRLCQTLKLFLKVKVCHTRKAHLLGLLAGLSSLK